MNNSVIIPMPSKWNACIHGSKAQGKIRRCAQFHWKYHSVWISNSQPISVQLLIPKNPLNTLWILFCSYWNTMQCVQMGIFAERVINTAQTVTDCQCAVPWFHKYLEIKTFQRSNISKQKHQNNGILQWVHKLLWREILKLDLFCPTIYNVQYDEEKYF